MFDYYCIEQKLRELDLSIFCEETKLFKEVGDSARFECRTDFGQGQPRDTDITVKWTRVSWQNQYTCIQLQLKLMAALIQTI